jgi:hypothetical protein
VRKESAGDELKDHQAEGIIWTSAPTQHNIERLPGQTSCSMLVVGGFFSHTFRKTKSNLPD